VKRLFIPILPILTLILSACASATATPIPSNPNPAPVSNIIPTPTDDPAILATLFPNMGGNNEMTRTDQQGAIILDVTPLNLGTPADTLEFNVAMNTHSIDLSMDLAILSTLTTDTGVNVQATLWDAPRGGHHVEGKLIFPAIVDGKRLVDGAGKIILTIVDVDAPSRIFEWELK
jgi:hypothetical protein